MMHSPIRVITVEREYGSRGGEFAHELATRLGWRLLDSELVDGAAKTAGVAPELAAKFDERLDPWYYRYGKVFWHDSAYPMTGLGDDQVFDSERMLSLIRQEIEDAAKRANACWWAGERPVRWPAIRAAFMSLCTPRRRPSATGLRARFPSRRRMPIRFWRLLTSAAPR